MAHHVFDMRRPMRGKTRELANRLQCEVDKLHAIALKEFHDDQREAKAYKAIFER